MQTTVSSQLGSLYIVATPIGNLKDISLRAIEVLQSADLIAAEDTRHARRLLDHYNITTKTLSLHEHNETERSSLLIQKLQAGQTVALISDAGTPLISDPGFRLVRQAQQAGIRVSPIPGACAAIAALSVAGLPTSQFVFEGFLPAKGAVRSKRIKQLAREARTIILYESKHRIISLIDELTEVFGPQRQASIAREISKTFETIITRDLQALKVWLHNDAMQQKGEFVVLLGGATIEEDQAKIERERILRILLQELPVKQASSLTAQIAGGVKKELYSLALEIKKE